jgi:hypothetical protein
MEARFSGEIVEMPMHEFGERAMPLGRHTGMWGIGFRGIFMPHFWGGGIIGLLLGGGVLAFAVYGVISLIRKNKTSDE